MMKKIISGLLLLVLTFTCALGAFAAAHVDINLGNNTFNLNISDKPNDQRLKEDAQYTIHRTASLIALAMESLGNRRYLSGLGLAIANQQKARDLYVAGAYQNAIFHSLRARDLVINILQQNGMPPRPEFLRDQRETPYGQGAPDNAMLDRELDMTRFGNDRDVFGMHFDLDTPEYGPNPGPNPNEQGGFGPGHNPPPGKPFGDPNQRLREDAQYVIHRTAMFINSALQSLGNKRRLSGLGLAIANQQKARELYMAGAYQNAIFHSLRARDLVIDILRQNRMPSRPEFMRDQREMPYGQAGPNSAILDRELDMSRFGNDRDVFRMHFDLDTPEYGPNSGSNPNGGFGPGHNPPPGKPFGDPNQRLREDAQYVIHRTAMFINSALQSLGNRRNLSGLGLAIANQQKARELYMAGAYQNAIFHSLRARDLVIDILRQNRMPSRPEFMRDQRETPYGQAGPNSAILDRELDMSRFGNDRDVFHMHFELDIN